MKPRAGPLSSKKKSTRAIASQRQASNPRTARARTSAAWASLSGAGASSDARPSSYLSA